MRAGWLLLGLWCGAVAAPPPWVADAPGASSVYLGTFDAPIGAVPHVHLLLVHGRPTTLPLRAEFRDGLMWLNGLAWDFDGFDPARYTAPATKAEVDERVRLRLDAAMKIPGGAAEIARGVSADSVWARYFRALDATLRDAVLAYRAALPRGEGAARRAGMRMLDTTLVVVDPTGPSPRFSGVDRVYVIEKGLNIGYDALPLANRAAVPAQRTAPTIERAREIYESLHSMFKFDVDVFAAVGAGGMSAQTGPPARDCIDALDRLRAAARDSAATFPDSPCLPSGLRREVVAVARGWQPGH